MDEQAFLHGLDPWPNDPHRLVYADWLDDQGRLDEATVLRAEVRMRAALAEAAEAASKVDPGWLARVFGGDDGLELVSLPADHRFAVSSEIQELTGFTPGDLDERLERLPQVVFRGNRRDLADAERRLLAAGAELRRVACGDAAHLVDALGWGALELVAYDPEAKITVIREIRRAAGLGLKDAKALSEANLPVAVFTGTPIALFHAKLRFDRYARVRIAPALRR